MHRRDTETLANVLTRSKCPVKVYESETFEALTFSWMQTYAYLFLPFLFLDMMATSTFTGFALVFGQEDEPNRATSIILMSTALVSHGIGLYFWTSALR